ncbi:MAG: hypothetical protein DWQ07_23210 [Chloroflexi bacterium]|nr:MAG: hypothetical protein DWQ07_23210 [Chloroflexota bacterium]MBL1194059.1 hypothetical protein [Chloroflexota bacterium]NOH11353.1 hypothetical protein [Chloroflexota bacterium]
MSNGILIYLAKLWFSLVLSGLFVASCTFLESTTKPEGQLLFVGESEDGLDSEAFVYNLEKEITNQLTDNEITDYYAKFSADGKQIAVAAGLPMPGIVLVDIETQDLYQLTNEETLVGYLSWSSDGEWIAFSKDMDSGSVNSDIYRVNIDNSTVSKFFGTDGNDIRVLWSPDGNQVAFSSNFEAIEFNDYDVYVYEIDDASIVRLTFEDSDDAPLSWSPDGKYLIVSSGTGLDNQDKRFFLLEVDTGNKEPLIEDKNYSTGKNENSAIWSPDGNWIAIDVDGRICIMDLKGELYDCYTEGYKYILTDWGP